MPYPAKGTVAKGFVIAAWLAPALRLTPEVPRMEGVCCSVERARITGHLERAEALARSRDISELLPLQRLVRALLLTALQDYRAAGRYPRNLEEQESTPVFIDGGQTRCAVAHLMELGGEPALVRRIAQQRNHARVRELANEPRLVAWLEAAGLTLAEAAAIQPTYSNKVYHGACVCGGPTRGSNWLEPLAGSESLGPAEAVLVGTLVDVGKYSATWMRVDSILGEAPDYSIGQEIPVTVLYDDMRLGDEHANGDTVVVPIQASAYSAKRELYGIALAPDDTYQCESAPGITVGPLEFDQLDHLLRDPDCHETLRSYNADWVKTSGKDAEQCSFSPASGTQPAPLTLSILFALTAGVVALRARRRALGRSEGCPPAAKPVPRG
jgi:hypothetical protein